MKKQDTSTASGEKSTTDKSGKFIIDPKEKASSSRRGKVIPDK